MGSCLSSGRSRRSSLHGSSHVPASRRKKSKRRSSSCSSSFDNTGEEEPLLHRIPGRMFLNGSTDNASLFSQQGKKGTNQDAMIVWENFGSLAETVFCGVFDGHGPYGHIAAKRVRDLLPLKLGSHLETWSPMSPARRSLKRSASTLLIERSQKTLCIYLPMENPESTIRIT